MVSPPRPSRESITLSSTCAQKGHFTGLSLLAGRLLRLPPLARVIYRATTLHEPTTARPQDCTPQKSPGTERLRQRLQAPFVLQGKSCRQQWPRVANRRRLRATEQGNPLE